MMNESLLFQACFKNPDGDANYKTLSFSKECLERMPDYESTEEAAKNELPNEEGGVELLDSLIKSASRLSIASIICFLIGSSIIYSPFG